MSNVVKFPQASNRVEVCAIADGENVIFRFKGYPEDIAELLHILVEEAVLYAKEK